MKTGLSILTFAGMVTASALFRLRGYDLTAVVLAYGAILPLLWPFRIKSPDFARTLAAKGRDSYIRSHAVPIGAAILTWFVALDWLHARLSVLSMAGSLVVSMVFIVVIATGGWKQLCKEAAAD